MYLHSLISLIILSLLSHYSTSAQVNADETLSLHVYLEGVYQDSNGMSTDLYRLGYLPSLTPSTFLSSIEDRDPAYNISPWYHNIDLENQNVETPFVDYVLISVRRDKTVESELCTFVGQLLPHGKIMIEDSACDLDIESEYYFIIEHRNHIPVMTPEPVAYNGEQFKYDFRSNDSFKGLFSSGQKEIKEGVFAMYAGNSDQFKSFSSRLDINVKDVSTLLGQLGMNSTYLRMDLNLDGDVNVHDISIVLRNQGVFSSVEFEFKSCAEDVIISLPEPSDITACDLANFEIPAAYVLDVCDTLGLATSKILEDSSCYEEILLTPLEGNYQQHQINCDGSIIAWYSRTHEEGIIHLIKNGRDTVLVKTPSEDTYSIRMSDNGTLVWRNGNFGDIYMSEAGTVPVLLSTTTSDNREAAISRDGTMIVWTGHVDGVGRRLIRSVMGGPPEIISTKSAYNPALSCDGLVIAFRATGDKTQTNIFRKVGSEAPVEISLTSDNNGIPLISCDGSIVIWSASTGFKKHIFASIDGGLPLKLSTTSVDNTDPNIGLDGKVVVWEGDLDDHVLSKRQIYKTQLIDLPTTKFGPTIKTYVDPIIISDLNVRNAGPKVSADNSAIIWIGGGRVNRLREGMDVKVAIDPPTPINSNNNTVMDCAGVTIVWRRGIHSASYPIYMKTCDDRFPGCPPEQLAIEYSHSDSTMSIRDTLYHMISAPSPSVIHCPELAPISACEVTTYTPPLAKVDLSCGGMATVEGRVIYESIDCLEELVVVLYEYRDLCEQIIAECYVDLIVIPVQLITCPSPVKVTACNFMKYEAAPATVVLGCGDTVQVEARVIDNTFINPDCMEATAINIAERQNRITDPKVNCDGSVVIWEGREIDSSRIKLYKSVGLSPYDAISGKDLSAFNGEMDCSGSRFVWTSTTQATGTDVYFSDQDSIYSIHTPEVDREPKISCDGQTATWYALIPGTDSAVIYKYLFGDTIANKITTARGGGNNVMSCDGSIVVWQAVDILGRPQIYKSVNSGRVTQITNSRPNSIEPIISCDGRTISWSETEGPLYRGIFASFNSGPPIFLSPFLLTAGFKNLPCDGQTVYWTGRDSNNISQIFMSYPDGSYDQITEILIGSGPFYTTVSCDGSTVAWVDRPVNEMTTLFIKYKGGQPFPIFSSPHIIQQPSISCDGETIAFRIRDTELYVINCSLLSDCLSGSITLQYSIQTACGELVEECVVEI